LNSNSFEYLSQLIPLLQFIVLCTLRLYYYTVAKNNVPIGFPISISVRLSVPTKGVVGTEYVYPEYVLSSKSPPVTSGSSVPKIIVGLEYAYPLSLRPSL